MFSAAHPARSSAWMAVSSNRMIIPLHSIRAEFYLIRDLRIDAESCGCKKHEIACTLFNTCKSVKSVKRC